MINEERSMINGSGA